MIHRSVRVSLHVHHNPEFLEAAEITFREDGYIETVPSKLTWAFPFLDQILQ